MVFVKYIMKSNGLNGFIIPKSFTYASNWIKTREILLNDITTIVDCSKVWKEVKLEMSIYLSQNKSNGTHFQSLIRKGNTLISIGNISKEDCQLFDFIINGVSDKEVNLAKKLKLNSKVLNDFVINHRGAPYQSLISENNDIKVLSGKQVNRYLLLSNKEKGYISSKLINNKNAYLIPNSILVQRIVCHLMQPYPRISIAATLNNLNNSSNYIIVDTINQLSNISYFDSKVLLGLINSKLISWFGYKFIFANAIRTVQFDNPTTSKIPIKDLNLKNKSEKASHDKIVELVDTLLELNKNIQGVQLESQKTQIKNKIQFCEDKIDKLVYELYELTEDEIKIVEGA